MDKLTLAQKKIIIASLAALAVFIVFIFFVYAPSKKTMAKVKNELEAVESSIAEIESLTKDSRSMEEGVNLLKERSEKLANKFTSKKEDALKMFSELAQKLNVEIVALTPQPKAMFLDENGAKTEIEGKICQRLSATLEIRSTYKSLVGYIEVLKESLPAYCVIERLSIHKPAADSAQLSAVLEMNLYLLT